MYCNKLDHNFNLKNAVLIKRKGNLLRIESASISESSIVNISPFLRKLKLISRYLKSKVKFKSQVCLYFQMQLIFTVFSTTIFSPFLYITDSTNKTNLFEEVSSWNKTSQIFFFQSCHSFTHLL